MGIKQKKIMAGNTPSCAIICCFFLFRSFILLFIIAVKLRSSTYTFFLLIYKYEIGVRSLHFFFAFFIFIDETVFRTLSMAECMRCVITISTRTLESSITIKKSHVWSTLVEEFLLCIIYIYI